jgi:hypothetical protein
MSRQGGGTSALPWRLSRAWNLALCCSRAADGSHGRPASATVGFMGVWGGMGEWRLWRDWVACVKGRWRRGILFLSLGWDVAIRSEDSDANIYNLLSCDSDARLGFRENLKFWQKKLATDPERSS